MPAAVGRFLAASGVRRVVSGHKPAGDCPLYSPGAQYDLAIEVFEGGLESLGVGPGSSVALIEGSEAERCPTAA